MPTLPKSLIFFGAGLMTAGTEFQLRQRHGALAAQARVFRQLVRQLARTKQGRATGSSPGQCPVRRPRAARPTDSFCRRSSA